MCATPQLPHLASHPCDTGSEAHATVGSCKRFGHDDLAAAQSQWTKGATVYHARAAGTAYHLRALTKIQATVVSAGGIVRKCGNRKRAVATFRVTKTTWRTLGHERRHRHAGAEHRAWYRIKPHVARGQRAIMLIVVSLLHKPVRASTAILPAERFDSPGLNRAHRDNRED